MFLTTHKLDKNEWGVYKGSAKLGTIEWCGLCEDWHFKVWPGVILSLRTLLELTPMLHDFNHSNYYTEVRH